MAKNLLVVNSDDFNFNKKEVEDNFENEIIGNFNKDTKEVKDLEKKPRKKKDTSVFEGQFTEVAIVYYFEWTCPNCGSFNVQRYKNIFDCVGPDWSSKDIPCEKCKMKFAIKENYGKLYKDI